MSRLFKRSDDKGSVLNDAFADTDVAEEAFAAWKAEIAAADEWLDTVDVDDLGRPDVVMSADAVPHTGRPLPKVRSISVAE